MEAHFAEYGDRRANGVDAQVDQRNWNRPSWWPSIHQRNVDSQAATRIMSPAGWR